MFRFVFDLATEPLGLPIEWYYEWIILLTIDVIAYLIAYDKVGVLFRSGSLSGKSAGSFVHWMIRTLVFAVIWVVTYGVIWIGKFVVTHKTQVAIVVCSIFFVAIVTKLLIWMKKRNELVKVSIKNEGEKIEYSTDKESR